MYSSMGNVMPSSATLALWLCGGEEVYSYTPGYTVEEVEWLSARPVHDWLALVLSVLQLLRKLPFTELPHKWSVIEKRIGALRGDTDPCHIELVRIFDEEVIPCI
jgi:hypothetical protein